MNIIFNKKNYLIINLKYDMYYENMYEYFSS